jgi:hypothetical protein
MSFHHHTNRAKLLIPLQTPESPEYPGEPWHMEGMKNEAIEMLTKMPRRGKSDVPRVGGHQYDPSKYQSILP